jgi:hypothetical protein
MSWIFYIELYINGCNLFLLVQLYWWEHNGLCTVGLPPQIVFVYATYILKLVQFLSYLVCGFVLVMRHNVMDKFGSSICHQVLSKNIFFRIDHVEDYLVSIWVT